MPLDPFKALLLISALSTPNDSQEHKQIPKLFKSHKTKPSRQGITLPNFVRFHRSWFRSATKLSRQVDNERRNPSPRQRPNVLKSRSGQQRRRRRGSSGRLTAFRAWEFFTFLPVFFFSCTHSHPRPWVGGNGLPKGGRSRGLSFQGSTMREGRWPKQQQLDWISSLVENGENLQARINGLSLAGGGHGITRSGSWV